MRKRGQQDLDFIAEEFNDRPDAVSRLPDTEESLHQTIERGSYSDSLTAPVIAWLLGRFCCLLVVSPLPQAERGRSP